jgi:hypothetical protein
VSAITRLAVAVGASVLFGLLAFATLPGDLDVTTDVVGYPTFASFNIDRYYWTYGIAVVLVPLAALAFYLVLTRTATGGFGPWGRAPIAGQHVEEAPPVVGWRVPAVAAARTLFIGAVLGLEVGIATDLGQGTATLLVTGAYGACVAIAALALGRRRSGVEVTRTINVLAAPSTVGGLYFVSRATTVTVAQTGVAHHYPWLSAWLALGAVVALYAAVLALVLRPRNGLTREGLERGLVLLVAAPVGLFLLVASIPGSLGEIDYFEEGQVLAGAELTRAGAFPWRDLLVSHGLLHDVAIGLTGFETLEDSRWGAVAAQQLLLAPLAWVGVYFLCAYLFGGNWLFLAGTQALVVTGHLFAVQVRFVLLPLVLLLLASVLRRPSVVRVAAFVTLLGAQVIVTPEALPLALSSIVAAAAYDAYRYERGTGVVAGFRRTWLVLVAGALLLAAWCAFLAANSALDDWIFSYRAFIPGYRLTFGIPMEDLLDSFELWAPIVALLAAFVFAVVRAHGRRPFVVDDWVVLAAGGLTLLYYVKFLSRADAGHLFQVFAVATPFVLYVAYRYVVALEAWLAGAIASRGIRWPQRHTVTLPLLVVLLATAPTSPLDVLRPDSSRFAATAEREPQVARVGFDSEPANDEAMITDVGRAVSERLGLGDTVFDLSNSPALFHYLHALPASTRYFIVNSAMREMAQDDLVEQLDRARPRVVVFSSQDVGLSGYDGVANQVRHYAVSQYLLDHYVPVLELHGFVLMEPEGEAPADPELYFRVGACDWGNVPSFFAPEPAADADSVRLPVRPLPSAAATTWQLTLPEGASAYRWLELVAPAPLREGRFELTDRLASTRDEFLVSQVRRAVESGVIDPLAGARSISTVPTRRIGFSSLGRGESTVRVRVGSCSQWRGYRSRTLYLTSTVPQDLREIRLVR